LCRANDANADVESSSSNSIHRNRATVDANFCFEIHFHGRADAIFPCVICRALFSFRIHLRAGEIIFSLEMLKTLVLPSETLHQCVCVAFPFTVMLTFASLSRLAAAAALMFEVFSPSAAVKDSCQKVFLLSVANGFLSSGPRLIRGKLLIMRQGGHK
jgi:hypothetical protein